MTQATTTLTRAEKRELLRLSGFFEVEGGEDAIMDFG